MTTHVETSETEDDFCEGRVRGAIASNYHGMSVLRAVPAVGTLPAIRGNCYGT